MALVTDRTLVVIPTYEEAGNVATVLTRLRRAVPGADVLVVDSASPDGTAALARKVGEELGGIDVLDQEAKRGLGAAYRDGFEEGLRRGYRVLVEMDADLSHDPAAVPALLAAVEDGAALAIGSRYVPGGSIPEWPALRRLVSRAGNRYAALVLGIEVRDATAGFRAFTADILGVIDFRSTRADGYGFQVEMAYRVLRAGGRVTEVPITFADRQRGTSKMSGRIVVEAMALVTWWGFRDRVLRRRRRPPS